MKIIKVFEQTFLSRKTYRVRKEFSQTMLTLITFLLWISPGLGDDKPPDCNAQDPSFCSSQCSYLWEKCNGNADCSYDLCSYLYPTLPPRYWHKCWDLINDCADQYSKYKGLPTKRGIVNKNVAYLLLKLHPFLNQTSQFGFLASGRMRRITNNFGTEFLGKRSNNNPTRTSASGRGAQTQSNNKPKPKFYSLPLDKFSKTKVVKRAEEILQELDNFKEKRVAGNGKVILGSEFLGKRGYYQLLGQKSNQDSEPEVQLKRFGNELLGKKSIQDPESEIQFKRFGNELLGKRLDREDADFKNSRIWLANKLIDADEFPNYRSDKGRFVRNSRFCDGSKTGVCGGTEPKEILSTEEYQETNHED